ARLEPDIPHRGRRHPRRRLPRALDRRPSRRPRACRPARADDSGAALQRRRRTRRESISAAVGQSAGRSGIPRGEGTVMFAHAVCLVNVHAVADGGVAETVRFSSRILGLGDAPRAGDTVVDGPGAVVLPGLVNAHDHLELNHYGRLKGRERYVNASQWIDDLRPRLSADPAIRNGRAHPLGERLFIGALKNLLSGVTTVAHHNPFYPELRRTIPIRIVRRYGWAHSFQLERQPAGARGEPGGDVAE